MSEKKRLSMNLSEGADRILRAYRRGMGLNRTQAVHRALAIASRFDSVKADGGRVLVEIQDLTYELDIL